MKILWKTVLILALITLISCVTETGTIANATKEIRLRYDSNVTKFWGLRRPHSDIEDSVEYCEWTDYKEGKSILRIKIEGEFVHGFKTFINLSFDKETSKEDSNVVIRKIVTENDKKRVVVSESDFQRSFAGIITGIQYLRTLLRTHRLKVGEKHKVDVITNKEKFFLFLEVKDEKNIKIRGFSFRVYVIKITVTDKDGKVIPESIEIWFIKEGKLAGYIAKFKLSGLAWGVCLRLTLNKAFVSKK